jgi:hypothetical protein
MIISENGNIFDCEFVEKTNGISLYRGYKIGYKSYNLQNNDIYYIAVRDDLIAYSRVKNRAIKNLDYLEYMNDFLNRPLDLTEQINIDTFAFIYRYGVVACDAVKQNLIREINRRNFVRKDTYSLQQLICLATHRYNFQFFIPWLATVIKTPFDTPEYHSDCNLCRNKCCELLYTGRCR